MRPVRILAVLTASLMLLSVASAGASTPPGPHGTLPSATEMANLVPRDLVIDHRGLGYLRGVDGSLTPYGHTIAADRPINPMARGGIPGPPGGGGGDVVTNSHWTLGGEVQRASGRVLFQMPDGWYVCSGTVVTDGVSGRSIVLTAAHCIYDDVAKTFALTAIFIPNQDDGGADGTDFDCSNDPYGCWILDHGVVDVNWTTRTFPDNIAWDYGFYVVSDTGAHSTASYTTTGNGSLDGTVGALNPDFTPPTVGDRTHALGYSYNADPNLMYCAENMGTEGADNYWLSKCDLSGGSSGGPWVQPMDEGTGSGPVISVNSWGYTFQSGMAGPKLHDNSAGTLFDHARTSSIGSGGEIVDPDAGDNPPPGEGEVSYTTSSSNQGSTWTATVTGSGSFSGSYDGGPSCSNVTTCEWSGIRKKTSSVTFNVTNGPILTIFRP